MKKKISILVVIGCLLLLVNMGIAGISGAQQVKTDEIENNQNQIMSFYQQQPLVPHADANGPYSADINEPILFFDTVCIWSKLIAQSFDIPLLIFKNTSEGISLIVLVIGAIVISPK